MLFKNIYLCPYCVCVCTGAHVFVCMCVCVPTEASRGAKDPGTLELELLMNAYHLPIWYWEPNQHPLQEQ